MHAPRSRCPMRCGLTEQRLHRRAIPPALCLQAWRPARLLGSLLLLSSPAGPASQSARCWAYPGAHMAERPDAHLLGHLLLLGGAHRGHTDERGIRGGLGE